jgi:hypothetical protein
MSSRGRQRGIRGGCWGGAGSFVGAQGAKDGVGELAAEQAQSFGAGLTTSGELVEVVAAGSEAAGLSDGDDV